MIVDFVLFIRILAKELNPINDIKRPIILTLNFCLIITISLYLENFHNEDNLLTIVILIASMILICKFIEAIFSFLLNKKNKNSRDEDVCFAKRINNLETLEFFEVKTTQLKKGDLILLEKGDVSSVDANVVLGNARVNDQSINGHLEQNHRNNNEGSNQIMAGSIITSGYLIVEVKSNVSFLQFFKHMGRNEKHHKTDQHPSEFAFSFFLTGITCVFLLLSLSFNVFLSYYGKFISPIILCAFFIILIPSTSSMVSGIILKCASLKLLEQSIKIKNLNALLLANQIDVLFIDKTGTLTEGNRSLSKIHPIIDDDRLLEKIFSASFFDSTIEGQSIATFCQNHLTKEKIQEIIKNSAPFPKINFSNEEAISGIDLPNLKIRKGSFKAITNYLNHYDENHYQNSFSIDEKKKIEQILSNIYKNGSSEIIVSANNQIIAILEFADFMKENVDKYLSKLQLFNIETIIITGDSEQNTTLLQEKIHLQHIIANATAKEKFEYVETYRKRGKIVAMIGDGINDLGAINAANIGITLSSADPELLKNADVIIENDNPSKITELITTASQIASIRGNITFFTLTSDISKFFIMSIAICQMAFAELEILNFQNFSSPINVITSGLIYNILLIFLFLPKIINFSKFKAHSQSKLFLQNMIIYGSLGILSPTLLIKIIDMSIK